MRKRKLILVLAVIGMTMAMMAPANAHGLSKETLEHRGWSCFDNSADGGAGNHCSRVAVGDYLEGGTGGLFLFVFNPGEGDTLIGFEWLKFTARDLTQRYCSAGDNWQKFPGVEGLYYCHRFLPTKTSMPN